MLAQGCLKTGCQAVSVCSDDEESVATVGSLGEGMRAMFHMCVGKGLTVRWDIRKESVVTLEKEGVHTHAAQDDVGSANAVAVYPVCIKCLPDGHQEMPDHPALSCL
eukprot:scaffold86897_cov20-Tisochrysis_lutea.AAC.1